MIKIQNNTPTREAIPVFLLGLAPESLADLSWTDPALGVSDCKWLPEVDQSPVLGEYERYGAETLTLAGDHVIVMRAVVPWSAEEIEADKKAKVPQEVTIQKACLELEDAGLLDDVETLVATLPRPYQIAWQRASVVRRDHALVEVVRMQRGMTEAEIDELFVRADAR